MAKVELADYPIQRPVRMPFSPLAYVRRGFERILSSPNRELFRLAFMGMEKETRALETKIIDNTTYKESRQELMSRVNAAVSANDRRLLTWVNISDMQELRLVGGSMVEETIKSRHLDPTEHAFIEQMMIYTGHETAHISPRAILFYGVEDVLEIFPIRENIDADLPAKTWPFFQRFAEHLDAYHDYFEQQTAIGAAFFASDTELSGLPALSGSNLPIFIDMICDAFALRFLSAYFMVSDKSSAVPAKQNSVQIDIESSLNAMRLPIMLVAPKIACDIKNIMRIVAEAEKKSGKPTSLKKALDERPIDKPVSFTISGRKITNKAWELRVSDNGKGIIVEELFRPIIDVSRDFPEAVAPALRSAALKWEEGNPFAFNNIPLGDLLEAVFQLGVSTGGTRGRGMGLWGSMAMLTRLGAQIKVGVTPRTGGLYQSIILPMDVSVSAEEIKAAASRFWRSRSSI